MKANAKKLLALILAMVMCLSLAAPAMATGAETAGDALAVQENFATASDLWVSDITLDPTGYSYTTNENGGTRYPADATKFIAWDKKSDHVDVEAVDMSPSTARVGQVGKKTKYTVTAKKAYATPSDVTPLKPTASIVVEDKDTVVKLTDSAIDAKFATLTNAQNWKETTKTVNSVTKDVVEERQGGIYQEEQANGGWTIYFKLSPVKNVSGDNSGEDQVFDTASKQVLYTKTTSDKQLVDDVDIRNALFAATVCNPDGTDGNSSDFYKDYRSTASLTNYTATYDKYAGSYEYDFTNVDKEIFTVTNNQTVDAALLAGGSNPENKVTSSFNVKMTTKVKVNGKDKTLVVSDETVVKNAMTAKLKSTGWALTEENPVVAGLNGTWTVNVIASYSIGWGDEPFFVALQDNTVFFARGIHDNGKPVITEFDSNGEPTRLNGVAIGLKDISKAGTYYNREKADGEKKLATIDEGTKVYGPIAVKAEDVPAECGVATKTNLDAHVGNSKIKYDRTGKVKYYVFQNTADLKKTLKNLHCKDTKKLNVIKLVINPVVNGKANDAVTVQEKKENALYLQSATDDVAVVTAVDNEWVAMIGNTDKNIMVEETTLDLEPTGAHINVTEYEVVDATCKKAGSKNSVVKCKRCGTVIATDSEVIPVVTTAVKRNEAAGSNFVYTDAEAKTKKYTHYIADYKIEKVAATKEQTGKVIVHYFCNLGEEHEELATETTVAKVNLEYADKWSYKEWGIQNTQWARDPAALFGYSPMIFDVDKVYENVPMTEDKYYHFAFRSLALQTDGKTYWGLAGAWKDGATTDAYAITPKANYIATATVTGIEIPAAECLNGKATVTLNVYKYNDANPTQTAPSSAAETAEWIAAKKLTLVETGTQVKEIVIPALKSHVDANNDGKCDNCDTEIKQVTPDVPTTDKVLTLDMVTVKNLTYTGKKQQPEVTVKAADGTELEEGIDYDVATFKKTAVGTYTITVKGKGDWSGKIKATVKIKKAANPIKVAKTSVSVKAKDVKKKAKTIALKVTKAQGKVTVKSSKKKVVSWKKNKITVAKGAKKGTYKLTFTAKGNKNYKKGTKTVKVVVK